MFTTAPVLGILPAPDKWRLDVPVVWQSKGLRFAIPCGWITDLASIPAALRGVMDINGCARCPALVHDWLYNTQAMPREFADDMLRSALLEYGATAFTARTYWMGVRAGGWKTWNDRLARGGGLQPDDFVDARSYLLAKNSVSFDTPT